MKILSKILTLKQDFVLIIQKRVMKTKVDVYYLILNGLWNSDGVILLHEKQIVSYIQKKIATH